MHIEAELVERVRITHTLDDEAGIHLYCDELKLRIVGSRPLMGGYHMTVGERVVRGGNHETNSERPIVTDFVSGDPDLVLDESSAGGR
jgi:hypothetical protein